MDEELAVRIGRRVRARRAATHRTQAVVAGLAGITTDYLYQIERGKKLPTVPVLTRLAVALRTPVAELLGDAAPPRAVRRLNDAGHALYQALTDPLSGAEPTAATDLHGRVKAAWRIWQTSPHRYSQVSAQVPQLVTDLELAARYPANVDDGTAHRQVQCCAVDLYNLLRTVSKRVGRGDLALLVADRAVRAAHLADDPLRLAVAQWNLAQVLLSDHQPEGAEAVALRAAESLRPQLAAGDLDAMAVFGALKLLGALAAARQGQAWTARDRVREVVPLAARTGERNVGWTVFGPTNVAMYAVSVEVEAGESTEALRLAEQVDQAQSPSIERRVAFLLEQAKGYQQRRDDASALLVLQAASAEAPEDMTYRPAAHDLLATVIHRGRGPVAGQAAQLAQRFGLPLG